MATAIASDYKHGRESARKPKEFHPIRTIQYALNKNTFVCVTMGDGKGKATQAAHTSSIVFRKG